MRKNYTLSKPRTRSELIAAFKEKSFAAPVPPVKPTVPPAKPDAPDVSADDPVDTAIEALKKAFADVQTAQKADPDDGTDPNDKKVDDVITQIAPLIDELTAAQGVDDANDPKAPTPTDGKQDPSTPAPSKLSVGNTTPKPNPINDNGDVENSAVCATDSCGHLATAHGDTEDGVNRGVCGMENCECLAFQADVGTPTDPEGDDSDGDGGGANNAGGDDAAPATGGAHGSLRGDFAIPSLDVTPSGGSGSTEAPTIQLAPPDSNPAPDMPGGMNMGPAFTIPVMVIQGQETGDGRGIALDALDWGAMPMPLMGLASATHDPSGMDQNDPSIMCGRIDSITVHPGENGTQLVSAQGYFLANDDGMYFADLVEQMGRVGISADISVLESEESMDGMDEFGWPIFSSTLTKGTIQGCTIVPFPAFQGAYIVLGDGGVIPEIPQTVKDMDIPEIVASGGQLIHWMATADCEPCSQGYELVASGAPVHPPKDWFSNPNFTLGDDRLREIFTGRGEKRFGGAFACPPTILDSGEVFGHLAPWGVCHTGQPGACVTPPHSKTDYAHFMRESQRVQTAEGEFVTVGVLTFHSGHAPTGRNVSASQAMAHYDNTATAFADVRMYEDEFGIAYHGALRPNITEEQLREIRAASPSGDWREFGGNLELVACLQVNQPGFPVAVVADGGRPLSLVAAGAYQIAELLEEAQQVLETANSEDAGLRLALAPILRSEQDRLRLTKLEFQKAEAKRRFTKLVGTR